MSDPAQREEAVFNAALKLPAGARAAFLEETCGDDVQLLRSVEALFQAMGVSVVLEKTAVLSIPLHEKPGDRIGPYKLLQQIGEGGCGVVYMADQLTPVKRRVALKVIKPGMDTREVLGRFEAERQALALMDHPNIARVLDAGATENGRPFFVMELVRGIPITRYCDDNKLKTEQRLELFIQVCQAIHHAHQKGIIHRDIKPSNILVADYDGVPVPKVIDFGIAKATAGQTLTDKTIFTALEQFIGTPAYMSPEQAKLSGLDIDIRSDIYSLGVLLYELLTSKTPFDANELLRAGFDEIRRIIREEDPPRPSQKLSTLAANEQTTTAKARQTDPPRLIRLIRGDLDWIVMKCLEKDRNRRYDTANGLALELTRFIKDEPITARPPSVAYRFQRMFRRHKLAFAAGFTVVAALIIGYCMAKVSVRSDPRDADYRLVMKDARDAYNRGEFKSAWTLTGKALSLKPGDLDAKQLRQKVENIIGVPGGNTIAASQSTNASGRIATTEAPPSAMNESAVQERAYKEAMERAALRMKDSDYASALASAEKALALKPGDTDARNLLQKAQRVYLQDSSLGYYQSAMMEGRVALSRGDYKAALAAADNALALEPGNTDAARMRQEAQHAIGRISAEAVASLPSPTNLFTVFGIRPLDFSFVWVPNMDTHGGAYVAVNELSWQDYYNLGGDTNLFGAIGPSISPAYFSFQNAERFIRSLNYRFKNKGYTFRLPSVEEYKILSGISDFSQIPDMVKANRTLGEYFPHKIQIRPFSVGENINGTNSLGLCNVIGNVREWTSDGKPFGYAYSWYPGYLGSNLNHSLTQAPSPGEEVGLRLVCCLSANINESMKMLDGNPPAPSH